MKIGVIGSGEVGQVLAAAFLTEGNEVMIGTRDTAKEEVVKWKSENPRGRAGSFEETAAFGELLVLCVAGDVAEAVVRKAGPRHFSGKIVIDTTNPITHGAPDKGVLKLFTAANTSLLEVLQQLIPDAKMVKAFNSVGSALMYKPKLKNGPPTMFICGNDALAKNTVTTLLSDFGWETEDMGSAEGARAIEPLCVLWCVPGFLRNQWTHAFKLIRP